MHNWDYPKTKPPADERWKLERLLTYGIGKEKLQSKTLKRHLPTLKIPEDTRAFLELLLWNKKF